MTGESRLFLEGDRFRNHSFLYDSMIHALYVSRLIDARTVGIEPASHRTKAFGRDSISIDDHPYSLMLLWCIGRGRL